MKEVLRLLDKGVNKEFKDDGVYILLFPPSSLKLGPPPPSPPLIYHNFYVLISILLGLLFPLLYFSMSPPLPPFTPPPFSPLMRILSCDHKPIVVP